MRKLNAQIKLAALVALAAPLLAVAQTGTQLTAHQAAAAYQCADTSASSTTYTCSTTPAIAALAKGDTFIFTAVNQNNSGAATLNIDGIGAVSIMKWQNAAALASGDLQAGAAVRLTYDGTNLEMDTVGNAPTTGTVGEADAKVATNQQVANAVIVPLVATAYGPTVAASTTSYAQPSGYVNFAGSTYRTAVAFPRSGTISHLYVCTGTANSGTGSLVISYVQGSGWNLATTPSALTVTFAASAVAGCVQDSTHSIAYTAGNLLTVQVVNNATTFSPYIDIIYAEFTGAN